MNEQLHHYLTRASETLRWELRRALYRLHGKLHDTVTLSTKQGRLTMSTRDNGIAANLFSNRQYEYDSSVRAVRFLKAQGFIPNQAACMADVGANIGLISTGLLLGNEIQFALAVEPEGRNYSLLQKNVEQNGLSARVHCLQMAAGEVAAMLTMELSPVNPGDHRIRATALAEGATERRGESTRQTVSVPSLPFVDILRLPELKNSPASKPDFMWIDVQGYEGYVFAGGADYLRQGIPAVSEVWPYGILRAGMSLERFSATVASIWTDYWVERRNKYIRYPMAVFDRYLEELGRDGYFENVIFTNKARYQA